MRDILSDPEKIEFYSDPNPMKRAQKQMLSPMVKRFYTIVSVEKHGDQYQVMLDGKAVKTPAKNQLQFLTMKSAQLVADEFDAQTTEINPALMPYTRLANTAIDGVANEIMAVRNDILRFTGNDLICYRADAPEKLVGLQANAWNKYLNWAQRQFGARLNVGQGVMHVEQPAESINAFGKAIDPYLDAFSLSCVHSMTALLGSAIMAIGVAEKFVTAAQAWADSHVDEDWTIENWGADFEATQRRENRWVDMNAAATMLSALQKNG